MPKINRKHNSKYHEAPWVAPAWFDTEIKPRQGCAHDQCSLCGGTGVKTDGTTCVHMISCTCPKCSVRI